MMVNDDLTLGYYLRQLRAGCWRVANHYDAKIDCEFYTTWLFTHPDGRWTRGTGFTDLEAVKEAYDTRPTNK